MKTNNIIYVDLVIEEYSPGELGNRTGVNEYHLYCVPLSYIGVNDRMILINIFNSLEQAINARAELQFTAWINFGQFIKEIGRECHPSHKNKFIKLQIVN